jgi:hypothetical protein
MEVCDRLLDSALAGPETDLISAYVPESEREPFYAWSRALARPEIADGAWVEELLRYEAPVQFVKRTALEDLDYGGRTYNRGEAVIVVLGSTNRDNAVFADPDLQLAPAQLSALPGLAMKAPAQAPSGTPHGEQSHTVRSV